jgi:hypothetical protein
MLWWKARSNATMRSFSHMRKMRRRSVSETHVATENQDEPGLYAIRLQGHLEDHWAARFDGLTLTREANGDTLLTGLVVDQAALYGLLRKVRDLGLPLLAVTRVSPAQAVESEVKHQGRPAASASG